MSFYKKCSNGNRKKNLKLTLFKIQWIQFIAEWYNNSIFKNYHFQMTFNVNDGKLIQMYWKGYCNKKSIKKNLLLQKTDVKVLSLSSEVFGYIRLNFNKKIHLMLSEVFDWELFGLLTSEFTKYHQTDSNKDYEHEGQNNNKFPDWVSCTLGFSKAELYIVDLSTAIKSSTTGVLCTRTHY